MVGQSTVHYRTVGITIYTDTYYIYSDCIWLELSVILMLILSFQHLIQSTIVSLQGLCSAFCSHLWGSEMAAPCGYQCDTAYLLGSLFVW